MTWRDERRRACEEVLWLATSGRGPRWALMRTGTTSQIIDTSVEDSIRG